METKIFLVRHAEKANNVVCPHGRPSLDLDERRVLSFEGIVQSFDLPNRLGKVDFIYSSPYVRCVMTAIPLAKESDCSINIMDCFRERVKTMSDDVVDNAFRRMQIMDELYKFPSGESRKEVALRFQQGIDLLLRKHKGETIAVFSHKNAILMYMMSRLNYEIRNDEVIITMHNGEVRTVNWNGSPQFFELKFDKGELIASDFI